MVRSLRLAWCLSGLISLASSRSVPAQHAGIDSDETVVFFPTDASLDATRGVWRVPIHGWVFEPEVDSKGRRALMSVFASRLGLTDDAVRDNTFRRRARLFLVDNERGQQITITLCGRSFALPRSEPNGHITATFELGAAEIAPVLQSAGQEGLVTYTAVADVNPAQRYEGTVRFVAPRGTSVISDIDDTIKITEVRDRWQLLRNTFLEPFAAVPGMDELYGRLRADGATFHYISASPWQLGQPLDRFLEQAGLPGGTMYLRPFRWKDDTFFNLFQDPREYRIPLLAGLLAQYPGRSFTLIGDSAELDPEIYAEIARRNPRQITRILIRDCTGEGETSPRYTAAFRGVPRPLWTVFQDPRSVGLAPPPKPQPPARPLPFDLAFAANRFPDGERPAVSPDGRFVAFAVRKPSLNGSRPTTGGDAHRLPSGAPVTAEACRLWLQDLAGGAPRPISPDGANALRPSWSPDGCRLTFYCDAGGRLRLHLFDCATLTARPIGDVPIRAQLQSGDEPQWTRDGRRVLVPVVPPFGAPHATPAPPPGRATGDPSVQVLGAGREAERFGSTASDRAAADLLTDDAVALALVDVGTGQVTVIPSAPGEAPISEARLSPSERYLAVLSVPAHAPDGSGSAQRLTIRRCEDGAVVHAIGNLDSTADDPLTRTFVWHAERDALVVGFGRRACVSEPLRGGQFRNIALAREVGDLDLSLFALTRGGTHLIVGVPAAASAGPGSARIQSLLMAPVDGGPSRRIDLPGDLRCESLALAAPERLWQPDPGQINVVLRNVRTGEVALASISMSTCAVTPRESRHERIRGVGAPANHAFELVRLERTDVAPDLYRLEPDLRSCRQVSNIEPRYADCAFGSVDWISTDVRCADGRTLSVQSSIVRPAALPQGGRAPLLVHVYGGARLAAWGDRFGGGDVGTLPAALFTTRGFAVMQVDAPLSPEGQPGRPIDDLAAVVVPQVRRACELGGIDANRIAVIGQSYGGYSTAALLSATDLFKAGIAIGGVFDLGGEFGRLDDRGGNSPMWWAEHGEGRMGTTPFDDPQRYLDNSPYWRAQRIQAPLLLLHGGDDDTCPVGEAHKLFSALRRLGRTVQLAEYPGEGHAITMWSQRNAIDAATRTCEFIERYAR